MKPIRTSLIAAACASLLAGQTNLVTTNVVVKDRKGASIAGLTAADFEVNDGGAKAGKVEVKASGAAAQKLVTVVFEAMGNEERRLAKQAALDLFKESKDANTLFAVFMITNQLSLLEPFTADHEALRAAVELATSGVANTRFAEVHAQKKDLLNRDTDLARIQARMLTDVKMANEEGSRRTIAFLNSLAAGLGTAPGRKAVAYLTWGLFVPANLDVPFLALQARANRGGVSFYGIDCRGVVTTGQNTGVQDFVRSATQVGGGGTENTGQVNFGGLDNVQDGVRRNIQSNLRVLSEATGGIFVGDTNDPKPFLRQLLDDVTNYYEITYDPGNTELDGSYRRTNVKVTAKDARVRDRDGYFALPAGQADLLPYEVAMLRALGATPAPRELEFRSGTVRLAQSPEGAAASVLVEVPLGGLQFQEDQTAGLYRARLTMLAQVKDPASGKVVQKFSRDLPLRGKLEQLPALRASNFSFREQISLAAGRYVVEAAVTDQLSGKTGARRTAFVAQARKAGVGMSSVSMVRSFQPAAKDLAGEEPFQFQGGRITPTLATTLKQAKDARMALFFTVYPDKTIAEAPKAVVQFLKDGAVAGSAAVTLPAADGLGRIPYVLNSPIESMPAGTYEIKVTVTQGGTAAQESAFVTIEG